MPFLRDFCVLPLDRMIETCAVNLPCSGAGTRMCQLCKFSPSRENTDCQCFRITLHMAIKITQQKNIEIGVCPLLYC
jgi:hypothetical protein